ncbi:hypothetical protein Tco_1570775 [Tanacetum coccineum]
MYPRFLQLFLNNQLKDLLEPFNDTYETPTHSKNVFSNMARKSKKFLGKVTPLFDSMLVQNQAPEGEVSHELQTEAHIEQILPSPSTYQTKQRKTQKHRRAKKVTELPQTSVPLDHGADEAVYKEGGDSVERAITTDASLVAAQDNNSPRRQETMRGVLAQTRSERVLEKPNEPPLPEGHTSRSREGSMEHTFELMDTVLPTPHDSPLTGGYILGSDKGRLKLKELMAICTKLLKQVESSDDDLDKEDASKQGKESDKTKSIFQDISAVSAPVTTADVAISTTEPRTPPTTVATAFIDEDLTIAQTLIKMKEEKDKGKGVLVEEEFEKPEKVKRRDQGLAQIESDAELAQRLHEEELAEIDVDHELAVRLTHEQQEKYTIKERARLLAKFFKRRKKQLAAEKVEAIRNKPPIRTQVRNKMITYRKHMDDDNQQQAESTKKRPKADSKEESSKKQKLEEDNDAEKEELKDSMDVVPKEDVAIDVESLATKYPIVDWKTHILNENMMYYQIIRAARSSKNYKIFSEMLDDFDRQDVIDLHRLVNERYKITSPEGYDLLLCGDLKTLFEPNEEDEIWKNQQDYNLISWRLFDSCGVHVLLMNTGVAIHMMIEKKYPLT